MNASDTAAKGRPFDEFEGLVGRRIFLWQKEYLERELNRANAAVEILARLRRGIGRRPEAAPELWPYTLQGIADPATSGDQVTNQELAAFLAFTFYGLHQQSRPIGMHKGGVRLGTALGSLRAKFQSKGSAAPLDARFQALCTATDLDEATIHLRGLISLLRTHSLPMDYGRFAGDLVRLQDPERHDDVCLRWGRDFYYRKSDDTDDETTDNNEQRDQA